jgi:hypothetical protein
VPSRTNLSGSNYPRHNKVFAQALAGSVSAILVFSALWIGVALGAGGNPAANLDQCANDPAPSPVTDGCNTNANQWLNGNLGASKSIYREDDSVPYRMRFSNLALAPVHTVIIEWDTTKGGKHSFDYLTTWDRTVGPTSTNPSGAANPCLGVTPCANPIITPIPHDPQVVTQIPGDFTMWGVESGSLSVSSLPAYSYPNGSGFLGDKSARLSISFKATQPNPVLAWGGHIATRTDWGTGGSAVAISGSPYHMRLIDLDGSGGNQDRSLSADSVIFPASITFIKDVANATNAQDFGFTTTGSLSPASFTLDDDPASSPPSNTQSYTNIMTFTTYTVSETALTGWDLTNRSCVVTSANGGSQSFPANTTTISINLKEGENVTCTFTNTPTPAPSLSIVKDATEANYDSTTDTIHYTIVATNNGNTTLAAVTVTDTEAVLGICTPVNGSSLAPGATMSCPASHAVSQADIDAGTYNNTACVDDGTATGSATEACDDADVPAVLGPELTTVKVDDLNGGKYEKIGDVIHYTITVTNTGNVTLTGVNVTDTEAVGLDCDSVAPGDQTGPFTINVGDHITCAASHTITQPDLDAGHYFNEACADDGTGGAAKACDNVDSPGKAQPTIATTPTLLPQDSITLNDLFLPAGGTLYVELQVNAPCGTTDPAPAYTTTFTVTGAGPYVTDNTVLVSSSETISWCTSYSGDDNNAARPLASDGEVIDITFNAPEVVLLGAVGFGIPLLLWGLWTQRRREVED